MENPNLTIELRAGERIDDLQCKGYRIIQNPAMFCFGMDAVLLANFVRHRMNGRYMDLGSGTGVIPILLSAKEPEKCRTMAEQEMGDAPSGLEQTAAYGMCGQRFIGLELQEPCAEMAARSVRLNGLQDRVHIEQGDIREVHTYETGASYDVVTSNPPYITDGHGLANPDAPKNIARHEVCVTLLDVIGAAAYLLKPGGSFYMVHKPFRLAEIFAGMMAKGLEPKRMQLVHPYIDKEPNMVLIEGIKGGRSQIKVEPPLIVYEAPGVYTKQLLATYEGEAKR